MQEVDFFVFNPGWGFNDGCVSKYRRNVQRGVNFFETFKDEGKSDKEMGKHEIFSKNELVVLKSSFTLRKSNHFVLYIRSKLN